MQKIDLLKSISFGERIAEEERNTLASYFVKTNQWEKLIGGKIDIVYGAKGSGKSALFMNLLNNIDSLNNKNICVCSAENPRGTTVFSELKTNPPASEDEFIFLWKLYFLSLCITETTKLFKSKQIDSIYNLLLEYKLVLENKDLKSLLLKIKRYITNMLHPESIGTNLSFNECSHNISGVEFKVYFKEPTPENIKKGQVSIDTLLNRLNRELINNGYIIWILLDRLDVAFADNTELEKNALKALFHVYQDFQAYDAICLKIFLRDDIWERIIDTGMRESSHITKTINIEWDEATILNLIIQRVVSNDNICEYYHINRDNILINFKEQEKLFYKLFPLQIDTGKNKPKTLNWILNRTTDGQKRYSPREIIHLLNESKEIQIKYLEIGKNQFEHDELLERSSFRSAIGKVSEVKLYKTLLPEYPSLRNYIVKFQNQKAEHSLETLSNLWDNIPIADAENIAKELVNIGFFETTGSLNNTKYKVPFIYRYALNLVQGKAY